MEGGQYPGGYQGSEYAGDQGFNGGAGNNMYNNAPPGGYRRVQSPPTMEHRMSPPTQYVAGSFPPPQMYQRGSPPYMGGFDQPGKWKLCATGVTGSGKSSSSSSTTPAVPDAPIVPQANSFAELKSAVSQMTESASTTGDEESSDAGASLSAAAEQVADDPGDSPRAVLRQFAVEPPSIDVNAILAHPLAKRIIVSEKGKVMYCPIPKAANSNWKFLIRKYEGFADYEDLAKAHDKSISGLKYVENYQPAELEALLADPSILKFTFARDPLTRTLSCYLNKFVNKEKDGEEYEVYMAQLYGWTWVKEHDLLNEERPTFEEFVTQISTQANEDMNEHWAPQSWLCGIGTFPFDFVGKLEEVDSYAPKIIEWISNGAESHFPTQDEIRFASVGTSTQVEQFYNDAVTSKVKETFKNDFELLRYNL